MRGRKHLAELVWSLWGDGSKYEGRLTAAPRALRTAKFLCRSVPGCGVQANLELRRVRRALKVAQSSGEVGVESVPLWGDGSKNERRLRSRPQAAHTETSCAGGCQSVLCRPTSFCSVWRGLQCA